MTITTFKLRRGTAERWAETNPILAAGEPGVERDTGLLKIGDGTKPWNTLPYATGGEGTGLPGPVGPEGPEGPQGLQGIQGPRGLTGPAGSIGPEGSEGPEGPQGFTGDKGDTGDTGAAGVDGLQGPQGLKGDTGDIGPAGPQGPEGPAGDVATTGTLPITHAHSVTVPSVANNLFTRVVFTTENADNVGGWSDSPNPHRITIMKSGTYRPFVGCGWLAHSLATLREHEVRYFTSAGVQKGSATLNCASVPNEATLWASAIQAVSLDGGDYIEFWIKQKSGAGLFCSYAFMQVIQEDPIGPEGPQGPPGSASGVPEVVTSIPTTGLVNGRIIRLKVAAGIYWDLMYDESITDAYKWVAVGVARKLANGDYDQINKTMAANYTQTDFGPGGPSLVVPENGYYYITISAEIWVVPTASGVWEYLLYVARADNTILTRLGCTAYASSASALLGGPTSLTRTDVAGFYPTPIALTKGETLKWRHEGSHTAVNGMRSRSRLVELAPQRLSG